MFDYDQSVIRRIREERSMSLSEFGRPLDMRGPQIQRLEKGTGYPNVKTLLRIANEYRVDIREFFVEAANGRGA